jgi:hypothetical protein
MEQECIIKEQSNFNIHEIALFYLDFHLFILPKLFSSVGLVCAASLYYAVPE